VAGASDVGDWFGALERASDVMTLGLGQVS
jgi:hypothetical protein